MFKRKFRLPKKSFKAERVFSSPIFVLKIAKNGESFSRFGIVVSKKVDKRATVRNKIKRKFRNCIEKKIEKIIKGYDFLFIIKDGIEKKIYCKMLLSQLEKENLLE